MFGHLFIFLTKHEGGNKLTGSIPTQIGLIVGLSEIKLGDNRFTGAIPSEFGNLTGLKEMSLGE